MSPESERVRVALLECLYQACVAFANDCCNRDVVLSIVKTLEAHDKQFGAPHG